MQEAGLIWYNPGVLPQPDRRKDAHFLAGPTMPDDVNQHDHRERRCPMLGHEVAFSYCRAPASKLPCRRIFDCWWETFDVEGFMRRHYGEDDIEKVLAPRKDKMLSIVELIEKARKARQEPAEEPDQ